MAPSLICILSARQCLKHRCKQHAGSAALVLGRIDISCCLIDGFTLFGSGRRLLYRTPASVVL